MDISYCKELVVLAECLNFSQAADRLFINQSTLSKHVAAAEKEAGFRIFERSTTKVELTESGRAYIENLREAAKNYELALLKGRSCQHESDTTVRVVGPFMNDRIRALVTRACSRTTSVNDGVRVSFAETGVRDSNDLLLNRAADVAVAFRYEKREEGLVFDHLYSMPFGVACHAAHPLATKKRLGFKDIEGMHVVAYPLEDRARYHDYVQSILKKHNVNVQIEHLAAGALCFPDIEDCIVFGVYFPGFARFGGNVITRPLDDSDDVFDVCVVHRKGEANPAILEFAACIVEEAELS